MIRRVYQQPDGTVRVLVPNPRLKHENETEAAFMSRIADQDAPKSGLQGLPFEDVEETLLPPRQDRKDWVMENRQVKVKKAITTGVTLEGGGK